MIQYVAHSLVFYARAVLLCGAKMPMQSGSQCQKPAPQNNPVYFSLDLMFVALDIVVSVKMTLYSPE